MAAKKPLPKSDHVMRFVPKGRQHRDAITDEFRGLLPTSMQLTAKDEGGLSVTWIEFYGTLGPPTKRTAAIAFRESLEKKKLPPQGLFATAQVSAILDAANGFGREMRVVHVPVPGNPGHAEVRRFTDEDMALLDLLATEVFSTYDFVRDLSLP